MRNAAPLGKGPHWCTPNEIFHRRLKTLSILGLSSGLLVTEELFGRPAHSGEAIRLAARPMAEDRRHQDFLLPNPVVLDENGPTPQDGLGAG
ncbi:hypothetical protein TNCV_3513471 [Trichonephila clavipes]|nr:hypothetical protein TNCV_3513471 [Trichonephila clavipes]